MFTILYEDDVILVVNKPNGLMVEPDRNGYPNLLQEVKKYLKSCTHEKEEVYAQHIHRLDRPVSGVVLFVKKREVLKNLSEQFAERKVKKYYQALTDHAPQQPVGKLEHWHKKEKKRALISEQRSEWAERVSLQYTVQSISENRFLWDIELHTGKFHQIRAQLAFVGCPIVGDQVYGSTVLFKSDAIALHARKLIFSHPVTNDLMVCESENWLSG